MYRITVAASSANRQHHICRSWHAGGGGTPVLAGSAIPGIGGSWNRFAIKGITPCTSPARQATAGVALHVFSLGTIKFVSRQPEGAGSSTIEWDTMVRALRKQDRTGELYT